MKKNLFLILSVSLNVFLLVVLTLVVFLIKQDQPRVLPFNIKTDKTINSSTASVVASTSEEFVYKDLVKIKTPLPNFKISSPFVIEGEARGNWFFEGTFPVILTDWDGLVIAQGVATAKGEWTTENFVPFTAQLSFTKPKLYDRGSLILKKDNPSGLPQNDDALEIPILFN